ncbi:MAG: SDR family oxidoreductase [Proteobacteria bacterium]|nr:SDR family oxidoreductase [Pseudomonadota bacterium]MDA1058794.1 SDR family oxidoreductase [Pseudomonadota bacterium]
MTKKIVCLGMGYVATALADRLSTQGWAVAGTCTSVAKRAALADGIVSITLFSPEHLLSAEILSGATHLISSIPPDDQGDAAAAWLAQNIGSAEGLEWAALLSTTGVYGDRHGDWADEESDLRPTAPRSQRRAQAEQQWLDLHREHGVPVHIFRLAGIYGPGRNPLDGIRAGTARRIVKPGLMLGRIHLEDILGVLMASIERPHAGSIYNVTDDEAAPPQDVVAYGCRALGVEPPPEEDFDTAEMSSHGRSFYLDSKRVRNDRIKRELGYRLRYPTYREGIAALMSEPPRARRRD